VGGGVEKVRLRLDPQEEHVVKDVPPQGEGLFAERILLITGVGKPGTVHPFRDRVRHATPLAFIKVSNDLIYWVTVEAKEAMIVTDRVKALAEFLLRQLPLSGAFVPRVLLGNILHCSFFLLNLVVDFFS
jgi:hypothetical protein